MQDIAALGARRISVGGSLARAAWGGFIRAARQLADGGCFGGFADAAPAADLNALFPRGPHQAADRVTGLLDFKPAARPEPVVLDGRYGRVEKLDPARHGAALWEAVKVEPSLWDYMPYGPFAAADQFQDWLNERAALERSLRLRHCCTGWPRARHCRA